MEGQTHSQCILVVDGDVLVRHAISDYLRQCGYTVVEAATTDEAMTVLGADDVAVNVVLCDALAPGWQTALGFRAWAAQHCQNVQVVLARNIEAAANKAAELCEEGPQLARPYDPESVVEYVKRLSSSAQGV